MELFASDLHINQILVDNSVGAVDLKMGGGRDRAGLAGERGERERDKYIYISNLCFLPRFSISSPLSPHPCAPLTA